MTAVMKRKRRSVVLTLARDGSTPHLFGDYLARAMSMSMAHHNTGPGPTRGGRVGDTKATLTRPGSTLIPSRG